jgi:signal transduction histidine kinase
MAGFQAFPTARGASSEAAYRVVQEALANIVRHAAASIATVQLLADGEMMILAIKDNGRGFDPNASANAGGLSVMRERVEFVGGTLVVEPAMGGGTLVRAEIPLEKEDAGVPAANEP